LNEKEVEEFPLTSLFEEGGTLNWKENKLVADGGGRGTGIASALEVEDVRKIGYEGT
jgi:hypothetical protein